MSDQPKIGQPKIGQPKIGQPRIRVLRVDDHPLLSEGIATIINSRWKVAGGNRNRDIADLLYISKETVKVHVKHIMDKLGAKDRTQAIAIAVRRGIIEL